jgi:AcrR family transcriptional regulator
VVDDEEATTRLLDAAESLFYDQGIQAVGLDAIRTRSGVSLKRLYALYSAKENLVEAYLRRRDRSWLGRLSSFVSANAARAEDTIPAVFDWLHTWFSEPDFRGCAFINSFGELGATSPSIVAAVREHKANVRAYLLGLTRELDLPDELADQLLTLVDGATVVAAITGDPAVARSSRDAAVTLLQAHQQRTG